MILFLLDHIPVYSQIYECLKTHPDTIKKIFLQRNFNAPDIVKLIHQNNIPVEHVDRAKLERMKHAKDLQGIEKCSTF